MKKYLLTALLGLFAFIGFTNASNYTFTSEDLSEYSPSSITFNNSFTLSSSSVVSFVANEQGYNILTICPASDTNQNLCCRLSTTDDGESFSDNSLCSFEGGVEYFLKGSDGDNFSSITISDGSSEGGDSGDSSGSLLPGGEGSLSGIITGLNSTITEFIPYLVYLGLGIITVIIGFVAVRWLVNRTQAKIRGTFSSGRRRK